MTPIYKKTIRVVLSLLIIVQFAVSGCSHRVGDLTLVSTKNIDLNASSLNIKEGKRYKGSDCTFALLGLIPFGIPNLKTAVDDALHQGGGNIMVDEVTYQNYAYFLIGSVACIKVEGTVLNGIAKQESTAALGEKSGITGD